MRVVDKLINILFDYDPEDDIPVITKDTKSEGITEEVSISEPKRAERHREQVKEETKTDDEVIVTKIENSPSHDKEEIPKFSEKEASVPPKKETSNFTFPIIDDDEDIEAGMNVESSRVKRKSMKEPRKDTKRYDYLSSTNYRAKSDSYTASRNNIYDQSEQKKPFTLSPIISPVYGILNENYKKEDIVTKDYTFNHTSGDSHIDLDSVRRKAYGTLEDEIEVSLNKEENILEEVPEDNTAVDKLKDDGLTIHDLLVDENASEDDIENEEEVFDIDIDDEKTKDEPKNNKKINTNEEPTGEEDLFDLIDSIYAGKEEDK